MMQSKEDEKKSPDSSADNIEATAKNEEELSDDLSDELNVDDSMFNKQELSAINGSIERFLHSLKKKEDELIRNKLFSRPLKRVFVLPLVIVAISIMVLVLVGGVYARSSLTEGSVGTGWVDGLFAVRTSAQESAQISEATKELISGIRDENEEQIVELFIDLINVETAERSVEEGRSPAETAPQDRRNRSTDEEQQSTSEGERVLSAEALILQQEITALKTALNQQIVISTNTEDLDEFRRQAEQLQSQQQDFQSLQGDFQNLSNRYDQANLQTDQYASLVSQIDAALTRKDFTTVSSLLQQFDAFLNNRSIRSNQLLRDLLRTGPAFSNSVRLYLASEGREQAVSTSNTGEIRRLEDQIDDMVSQIEGLTDRNQVLTIDQERFNEETEITERQLQNEITNLVSQIQELTDRNQTLLINKEQSDAEFVTLQEQSDAQATTSQEQSATLREQSNAQVATLQEQSDTEFATLQEQHDIQIEILEAQLQQVLAELENIRRAR